MSVFSLIYRTQKAKIGVVTLDASVQEVHSMPSTITDNPVEEGAKITDHVQLDPLRLEIT